MQQTLNRLTWLLCSYKRCQIDRQAKPSFSVISRYCFSSNSDKDGSNSNDKFKSIQSLLHALESGKLSVNEVHQELVESYDLKNNDRVTEKVGLNSFANLDHQRATRTGFPEAVFAAGKTPQQIATILDDMAKNVNDIVKKDGLKLGDVPAISQKAILATR